MGNEPKKPYIPKMVKKTVKKPISFESEKVDMATEVEKNADKLIEVIELQIAELDEKIEKKIAVSEQHEA